MDTTQESRSRRSERTALAIFVFALVNFAAFCSIAVALGGDALNGHQSYGRYFLASHGRLTEVSRAVFRYSQVHSISVFITHAAGILAAVYFNATRRRSSSTPRKGGTA